MKAPCRAQIVICIGSIRFTKSFVDVELLELT